MSKAKTNFLTRLKDRTVIVLALAVYLGLWVFTGNAEGTVISMWERVNYIFSSPLRLFLSLSGAVILVVVFLRLGKEDS